MIREERLVLRLYEMLELVFTDNQGVELGIMIIWDDQGEEVSIMLALPC